MSSFHPQKKTQEILNAAMGYIESVEYPVGLRWVFYRLLQDNYFTCKGDYAKLKAYASDARKAFWNEWRPWTLIDNGREVIESRKPVDRSAMIELLPYYTELSPSLFKGQECVPFLIFESATMAGQFEHFAPWSDRAALRGDASVPHKWNIAKRCDQLADVYELPVHILYFGDYDPKGLQIPQSAMADVMEWVEPETELLFTRCGITPEQAERFDLSKKFAKLDTYEWEALEAEDAGSVIQQALATAIDMDLLQIQISSAETKTIELREEIKEALVPLLASQ